MNIYNIYSIAKLIILYISVLNWCLHNKFELVELDQTGDSESDTEGNKYGIERIIEALHAHTWPDIVFKSNVSQISAIKKKICVHKYFSFLYTKIKMCFVTDTASVYETLKVNEIEEQFENIRLSRDPSERLRMQDMLGQYRLEII